LSGRVLLAALMLHGPLPRAELVELHRDHALDLDAELARLSNLDLVTLEDSDRADGEIVAVKTRLLQPLTRELRQWNLL
jgi:hypothetical protein